MSLCISLYIFTQITTNRKLQTPNLLSIPHLNLPQDSPVPLFFTKYLIGKRGWLISVTADQRFLLRTPPPHQQRRSQG
jgi:hypothetical protein